jgi:hypothetical protein
VLEFDRLPLVPILVHRAAALIERPSPPLEPPASKR